MSLQIWLPLNGDLHNQGLNNITVTNNGVTVNNNGKLGKCYQFGTAASDILIPATAMTSFTTECSICFWIKILSWNTSYATFFQAGISSTAWTAYIFGLLRNNANSNCCFTISNGSSASNANYLTPTLELNTWYHLGLIYKTGHCLIYVNGQLYQDYTTSIVPKFNGINVIRIGRCANGSSYQTNCLLNDFRIYNHALSTTEVEEISKSLILHYQLNNNGMGGENLFKGTIMRPIDRTNFVSSSSTDWTKYLRYYNGNTSIHTFTEEDGIYIDTIKLNSTANLGICFGRLASEINLDSSSYYTISCEAKCTKAGAGIDIGLSYLTTNDSWVWRGGSNRKLFNNTTDWQFFTHTFKPDSDTKAIDYCFTVVGVSSGTDTLSIRKCKLEKGSVATFWSPAPEDLGIDSSIIYDSSGYNHNGTITGQLEIAQPSPKFNCATYMNNTSTSNHIECNDEITLPIDNITVSLWVKANKSTNQVIFASPQIEFGILNNLGYCNPNGNQAGWTLNNFITNEWNHIVIIRQNSTYKLYINNILETQNGAQNNYNHNKNVLWLLNRGNNNTYAGNASISDFRIYATALTAAQVKELYRTSMIVDGTAVRPRDLE